ncbi:DEAD/DEAH box helicase [Mycolicibacterium conceptionense]|uniref:Helicase n=1 Tax=Mycolicibacterium conceptionense TaxID=451644 RepID=A0A1A1YK51_9MYCO|nr:DEAD/DEAH box helicase [Mycolicibacterium conceptionense]OBF14422.1 helicase [Mycolicibacterium conceptionense]OBF31686.1 helicase [Mycolicibacterium conceptionense]OBH97040.1 helicase [Mycolicibacterium conceptionense]
MTSYTEFLARKAAAAPIEGRRITTADVHPSLHPWQAELVRWAVETSRAAIWADTGLGKTRMQLEWARLSGDRALVVAPLAVCQQTVREAATLGISARYVKHPDEIDPFGRISVTNYERLQAFNPGWFDAVVLDESSILKQSDGATRTMLIDWARDIPHRLACSATPAPNDPEELTNQAEWLGHMSRTHMLAAYFVHDSDGWRIKGHAGGPMVDWMASWAVALRRPSDMGGSDEGYVLPGLEIVPHLVSAQVEEEGALFAVELGGVQGRAAVRKQTLDDRVAVTADLVAAEPDEPWLLWCGLNSEAEALADAIPGSVNVHGAMHPDQKADALMDFADGGFRVLITKPQIASQGLNYQHCARMAFVGLGDSYEQYYQAIRRCYRYGQTRVVQAHVILSDLESQIATNVARKEQQANVITDALIAARARSIA